jgi:hypothetical protein
MVERPTALERAFQLADSGAYKTVEQIKRALAAEGYAQSQIIGPSLRRQLRDRIRSARAAKE